MIGDKLTVGVHLTAHNRANGERLNLQHQRLLAQRCGSQHSGLDFRQEALSNHSKIDGSATVRHGCWPPSLVRADACHGRVIRILGTRGNTATTNRKFPLRQRYIRARDAPQHSYQIIKKVAAQREIAPAAVTSTHGYSESRKMGRTPGAITYRRAIEALERAQLILIKILAQQDEVRADLQLLITELANLTRRDNGRSR